MKTQKSFFEHNYMTDAEPQLQIIAISGIVDR